MSFRSQKIKQINGQNHSQVFSTIEVDAKPPTASYCYRRRKLINQSKEDNRPKTTNNFNNSFNHSLNSSFEHSHRGFMKTIDQAENELNSVFKQSLSPFVRLKIKQLSKSRHKRNISIENQLINPEMSMTLNNISIMTTRNAKLFENRQAVDDAYVKNTKQKIYRMINMKKESEGDYSKVRCGIRKKMVKVDNQKSKHYTIDVPHVNQQEWNKDWCIDKQKQVSRYRQRLKQRCQKFRTKFNITQS